MRTWDRHSRSLRSWGLFPALQQHFPSDLGEATLSLFTFILLPGKEEGSLFAPMALGRYLIPFDCSELPQGFDQPPLTQLEQMTAVFLPGQEYAGCFSRAATGFLELKAPEVGMLLSLDNMALCTLLAPRSIQTSRHISEIYGASEDLA